MSVKNIACLVTVLLVWSGTAFAGDTIRRNYHETFPVGLKARLRIDQGDGDVTIRSWDRSEIEITVRYRAEHHSIGVGDDDRRFSIEFHHDGNEVEAIEKRHRDGFFGLRAVRMYEYVWEINAPADTRLFIDGDDGNLDIENWRGRIDLSLDDGDIELRGVHAEETRIELGDGDIEIDDHEGDLDITIDDGDVSIDGLVAASCILRYEDGDVRISRATGDFRIDGDDGRLRLFDTAARRLRVETGDGDIELRLRQSTEIDYEIETDDGDVDIRLPAGVSATFSIDVDDGSIRLDLPEETDIRERRGRASGTLGDGNGRIRITAEDGRITVRADR